MLIAARPLKEHRQDLATQHSWTHHLCLEVSFLPEAVREVAVPETAARWRVLLIVLLQVLRGGNPKLQESEGRVPVTEGRRQPAWTPQSSLWREDPSPWSACEVGHAVPLKTELA